MSLSPPSASCSACMQQKKDNKTEQEHEEVLSCHGHAILLITVQNNEDANQNHGSRRIKYFFLISQWRIILENDCPRLLIKSRLTRKKNKPFHISREKIRPFTNLTKILFTTLCSVFSEIFLYAAMSFCKEKSVRFRGV